MSGSPRIVINPGSVVSPAVWARRGVFGGSVRYITEQNESTTTVAIESSIIASDEPVIINPGRHGQATSLYVAGPPVPGKNVTFEQGKPGVSFHVESGRAIFDVIEAKSLVVSQDANIPINVAPLSVTATVTPPIWNMVRGQLAILTLDSTVTLQTSNAVPGGIYWLLVKQTVGGHDIVWPATFKFPDGEPPTLSSRANGMDIIRIICVDATLFLAVADSNYM